MPGPLPNPNAIRRNAPTIPTTNLPVSGFSGPIPEPIEDLDDMERRYFEWAWRQPAAAAWHSSDVEVVAEWARLKAYATRCMRGEISKETATGRVITESVSSAVYAQITTREDRLMLSPVARLKARAGIVDDPPDRSEDDDEAPSRFESFGESA
jgi:hypothetical protein